MSQFDQDTRSAEAAQSRWLGANNSMQLTALGAAADAVAVQSARTSTESEFSEP